MTANAVNECRMGEGNSDVCVVPISSRSEIEGTEGTLSALVTSPHGKDHKIVFYRNINVFSFELLDTSHRHSITYRLDELLCVRTTSVKVKSGLPVIPENKVTLQSFVFLILEIV
ncbi:hypothetical protein COOONC_20433 [Cooperia oncophora]